MLLAGPLTGGPHVAYRFFLGGIKYNVQEPQYHGSHNFVVYCKRSNFRAVHIFAHFAHGLICAKI